MRLDVFIGSILRESAAKTLASKVDLAFKRSPLIRRIKLQRVEKAKDSRPSCKIPLIPPQMLAIGNPVLRVRTIRAS